MRLVHSVPAPIGYDGGVGAQGGRESGGLLLQWRHMYMMMVITS